jgi:hypothetical protein
MNGTSSQQWIKMQQRIANGDRTVATGVFDIHPGCQDVGGLCCRCSVWLWVSEGSTTATGSHLELGSGSNTIVPPSRFFPARVAALTLRCAAQ